MQIKNSDSKKILIVDDELFFCELLYTWLVDEGWYALCAKNGKEGEAVFLNSKVDLIITDIFMPDVDGIEFVQNIRVINQFIPILAISGNDCDCNYLDIIKRFGANKVLNKKTINRGKLISVIKEML